MGPIQTLQELLAFLARRAPLIFAAIGLGVLGAIVVAVTSTPQYQSHTILSARVGGVSTSATTSDPMTSQARLLQVVEQRLTNRETLLSLADKYDMFTGLPAADRVEVMRSSITLVSEQAVQIGFAPDGSVSSIIIFARADGSEKAASLTNDLAQMLMDQTRDSRQTRARDTLAFLEAQQARLQQELRAVESESQAYVNENFDVMPVNVDLRRTAVQELATSIQETTREVRALEAELQSIDEQGGSQRRRIQIENLLGPLRQELADMQGDQGGMDDYFRRAAQAERQIAQFEIRQERLRTQLDEVTNQVNDAAAIVSRGTGEAAAFYEIVEPATPSDAPISRSRKMTVVLGSVVGAFLGLMIAFVADLIQPKLRSPMQLERECAMRPVMIIPKLTSPSEIRRQRIAWAGGFLLLVLSLAAGFFAASGG